MKNENLTGAVDIISAVIAGIVFIILLFVLQWNFFVDAALAVGIYIGSVYFLKPRRKLGNVDVEEIPDGEELRKRLDEARSDLSSIEASMRQINDAEIRAGAEQLKATAAKILDYLEAHPEKIRRARQFIDYYQDTADRLLKRYAEFEKTGLETPETLRLREEAAKAVVTLNTAFEQQFERIMHSEILDMDAELKLLEQTMKAEGGK